MSENLNETTDESGYGCECGGTLQSQTLDSFDFTPFARLGANITLRDVPGLRCDACGDEQLDGEMINQVFRFLAMEITKLPLLLPPELSRFLRRCLGNTQQKLADRMNLARETVANWERGSHPISPQNDLNLRALMLSAVFGSPVRVSATLTAAAAKALGVVRTERAQPGQRFPALQELVVADYLNA